MVCSPPSMTTDVATRWGQRCAHCGAGAGIKLDPNALPSGGCPCQMDSVFSTLDGQVLPPSGAPKQNWAYPARPTSSRSRIGKSGQGQGRGTRVTSPWPCVSEPAPQTEDDYDTTSMPPVEETEHRDPLPIPKKIDIDSQKLLTSVYAKAQKAQTTVYSAPSNQIRSGSGRRQLLRYTDAGITRDFPSANMSSSTKIIQGFPRLLSRYHHPILGGKPPRGSSAELPVGTSANHSRDALPMYCSMNYRGPPKLTVVQPTMSLL